MPKSNVNSRLKGHNYERKIAEEFRDILGYQHCRTSRFESKMMDDQKVDLCNTGRLYVQCKAWERGLNPHNLLDEMPKTDDHINLIFHKKNRKGEVVMMTKDDFYKIYKILREHGYN